MSTDERIEEPTTTSAPIPKDGYYTAWVQLDTGGTMPAYVRVKDGLIMASDEDELKPSACSQFRPVSTQQFCGVWPSEAAMELETLRTANAALVESVQDRERERDYANDVTASAIADNKRLTEKVKRLEEAMYTLEIRGDQMNDELYPPDPNCSCCISPPCDDCTDWASMRLAKRDWEDAKQKAAKAKGQP